MDYVGRPISHPQVQPRAHCRPPPSLPPPGHALNACLSWNQTGWKTGPLKIRLDQDMGGEKRIKKAHDCNFGAVIFFYFDSLCSIPMWSDQQIWQGELESLCRLSDDPWVQPHGPFTLPLQGWNWWNSKQKQKSLVLKQFRCHLDLGALCPQWPDLPNYGSPLIPLPDVRNPQQIQVSRCRRRLKALAVKSSDPIGSRGQVTWCYSLPHLHGRRFT